MIWPPACTRQGQSEEAAGAHNCKSMAHDEEQDEDRRRRPSREWADTMATDAGDWMARTITQDQKLNDLNSINSLTTFNERLCFHLVDVPRQVGGQGRCWPHRTGENQPVQWPEEPSWSGGIRDPGLEDGCAGTGRRFPQGTTRLHTTARSSPSPASPPPPYRLATVAWPEVATGPIDRNQQG